MTCAAAFVSNATLTFSVFGSVNPGVVSKSKTRIVEVNCRIVEDIASATATIANTGDDLAARVIGKRADEGFVFMKRMTDMLAALGRVV